MAKSGNNADEELDRPALAEAILATLKDHSSLGLHLCEVPFDWNDAPHRLKGRFYYIAFADGVPSVKRLVDYLYRCLVPYCLPKKLYEPILADADPTVDYDRIIGLGDEAKSLFIRAKNQLDSGGEVGELILYALLEWALQAPRFVSKMYLKTNNNMPVHGTDGIHVGYDPEADLMTIYFGESKIYGSFSEAASAAFGSIVELISNDGQITREINILNNLSDIEQMSSAAQAKIAEYIDPYSASPALLHTRISHACLLGFEYKAYQRMLTLPPTEVLAAFEQKYRKRVASACRVVGRHYVNLLPPTTNVDLFLLPIPSVKDLRALFYGRLGVAS